MVYIFPYVFSLGFWVIFFTSVNMPRLSAYTFLALIIWFVTAVIFVGRKQLLRSWVLWLNFFLYLISSFGLILIIMSEVSRNLFIAVSGILAGLLVYAMSTYFRLGQNRSSRVYLELISFIYLLTFWQILTGLYFFIISYDFSPWTAAPLVFVLTFLLGKGIASVQNSRIQGEMSSFAILSLTTTELFLVLELLPLHHLVLATLLTIWFFFVVELTVRNREVTTKRSTFKRYTTLVLIVMALILLTSRWG